MEKLVRLAARPPTAVFEQPGPELVAANLDLRRQVRARLSSLACALPWLQVRERSVDSDLEICCWAPLPLGRAARAGDLFGALATPLARAGRAAVAGRTALCPKTCPILSSREWVFDELELRDYTEAELQGFDARFLRNRKEVLEAILAQRIGLGTRPLSLKLHPSNPCNLRCPMCYIDDFSLRRDPSWYLDESFEAGLVYLEQLVVHGGEPLFCDVSKHFILEKELPPQVFVSFVTNAQLLSDEILRRLERRRVGFIDVSLDACTPGTYAQVRKGGRFAVVLERARALVQMERARSQHFRVRGGFVIQPGNAEEIAGFYSLCLELGLVPNYTFVGATTAPVPDRRQLAAMQRGLDEVAVLAARAHDAWTVAAVRPYQELLGGQDPARLEEKGWDGFRHSAANLDAAALGWRLLVRGFKAADAVLR